MSLRRLLLVAGVDLKHNLKRPLFWVMIVVLGLTLWGLSRGNVRISSGDSQVGGTKAWITSEFAAAQLVTMLITLLYSFFAAVAAGMSLIQDDEQKVGPILHATPLRADEYIYGKFASLCGAFLVAIGLHLAFGMFFNHVLPNPVADEVRGPFHAMNYIRPMLLLGLPTLYFFLATSFAVGAITRRPILVFVLPVAILLVAGFFLWNWSPAWLQPGWNRLLMILDPAGFRWLNETWLKVDRGVQFYNTGHLGTDATFWLNRLWLVSVGTLSVWLAQRRFAGSLRGEKSPKPVRARRRAAAVTAEPTTPTPAGSAPLAGLGMTVRPPTFLSAAWTIARAEARELRSQAGLYLFIPIILLQTIGTTLFEVGAFDTPLLVTPGTAVVRAFNTITLLSVLLLLFYTVESMERERAVGFAPIFKATPVPSLSLLLGKTLANLLVAVFVQLAVFVAIVIALLVQGKVGFDLTPFLLIWVGCLTPTILLWVSFVILLHALTGNRYTTYALALGALILTGYLQTTGKMNWVGNWDLWSVLRWTDMGTLELNGPAILLNRVMALGLAAFLLVLGLRLYRRYEADATRTVHRLAPGRLLRNSVGLLPWLIVPLAAGIALFVQLDRGFQGRGYEKKMKDYWRRNIATWKGAPLPAMLHADIDLDLEPARRSFKLKGSYRLVNILDAPLRQIPLTGSPTWTKLAWTMNDSAYTPEDRLKLFVFTPPNPLDPGDSLTIGFRYEGVYPPGFTKNGGGSEQFILPSGVVLTSFEPSFVPVLGFQEQIGVDDKNRTDAKDYPDDFYVGVTRAAFGGGLPHTTRIRVSGPAGYRYHSVGTLVSDETTGGRRSMLWVSDHPVNIFNVVAGRWAEKKGIGTAIYYHPEHTYNIEEMSEALDAARKYYSEWFYPFPWQELKISEFPALAFYAQGFPTNITFSEGIGFLTKSDPRANTAFLVTAHESAHQWWGNIIMPGEGPGGDILSEGMAHYSTILLFGQVKGLRQRIEFCKGIEARYGDRRQLDSERPLVRIDGSKNGDQTVTYDKGGWVFWMLHNLMGRENALAGLQSFVRQYSTGPDHAVLQDFVASLRPFAPDSTAFDAFARQWFYSVVVPEYRFSDPKKTKRSPAPGDSAAWEASVTLKNIGTGVMPVEVAAFRGERFPREPAAPNKPAAGDGAAQAAAVKPDKVYAEARTSVTLAAGESRTLTILCPFEPEQMIVDPDAMVLQLNRKHAVARF